MKLIEYTDPDGYKHLAWVKDNQGIEQAAGGLPADPPDIRSLNWDGLIRDIHNALVEQRLTDWQAVQANQNAISGIVNKIIRRHIISLYRGDNNGR